MSSFRLRSRNNLILIAFATLFFPNVASAQNSPSGPAPVNPLAQSHGPSAANNFFAAGRQKASEAPEITLPEGATIGDAADRVRAIAVEASKSLDDLTGNTVTPREQAEIDAIAERKRRVMILEEQLKEVKLAKQIWHELHGKEGSDDTEVKRLQDEKARLEDQIRQMEQNPASAASDVPAIPVVSQINGAGRSAVAVILTPYAGVTSAKVGTVLPNGMRVTSIDANGVTVDHGGDLKTLPFGASVPRFRPQPPQVATPIH